MQVTEALRSRFSCRAFLDRPVSLSVIREILDEARKAPSGGNLQPWQVHVVAGKALTGLVEDIRRRFVAAPVGEGTEYDIYPPHLAEPYRTRRFKTGMDLYRALGIAREDTEARQRQWQRNYEFFGAPVGLFFALDRALGPPQWSDVGMYILAVMLLARERGLHSCAQEAWAAWHGAVAAHIQLPASQMLFCGMAIGYGDESAPANAFRTERAPLDEFAVFHD
ncbi:MAG: nitroreductase [Rhodobiaceae bacterium]|nr:nitroreductase [Rhodobiaceae bacterium]